MSRSLTPTNKPVLRIGLSKLVKRSEESDGSLVDKPKSPYTPGNKPCFRIGLSRKVRKPNESDLPVNSLIEQKCGKELTPLKRYGLPKKETKPDNFSKLLTSPIISETKQSPTKPCKDYNCDKTELTPKTSKLTISNSNPTENNNEFTPKLPKRKIEKKKQNNEVQSLDDTPPINRNNNLSEKDKNKTGGKLEQSDESSDDEFLSRKCVRNKKQNIRATKDPETSLVPAKIGSSQNKIQKSNPKNDFSVSVKLSGDNETKTVKPSCEISTEKGVKSQKVDMDGEFLTSKISRTKKNTDKNEKSNNKTANESKTVEAASKISTEKDVNSQKVDAGNASSDEDFLTSKISRGKENTLKNNSTNSRKDTRKRKLLEQFDSSSDNEPLMKKVIRTEDTEKRQTHLPCDTPTNIRSSRTVKKSTSLRSSLSLKKSASSISIDSDSEDDFIKRPKAAKHTLSSSQSTTSSQEENPSTEELRDTVFALQCRVIEKENLVQELKQSLIYRKKHDVEDLEKLTQVWKIGCQEAMEQLHKNLSQNIPITMSQLLTRLNIPKKLFSYDSENSCFV